MKLLTRVLFLIGLVTLLSLMSYAKPERQLQIGKLFYKTLTVEKPTLIRAWWDVPIPPLVDPSNKAMTPFYKKMAKLLRGTQKDKVRIAMYGDSNLTSDFFTGEMRRFLQKKYGDGGHGFVAAIRPWPWYLHMDVLHGFDNGWDALASTTHFRDNKLGHGGIAAQSIRPGATLWVTTMGPGSPVGGTASVFDIFYLKNLNYGRFTVCGDGVELGTVDAAATAPIPGFFRLELPDAWHHIDVVAEDAEPVRIFGIALERPGSGVVVDSLGVGALSDWTQSSDRQDPVINLETLRRRDYDLVIFFTGTNMADLERHPGWMKEILELHRTALPDASLLVFSPPDIVSRITDAKGWQRVVETGRQDRQAAADHGAAFWDFWEAMGGDAATVKFYYNNWASGDLCHLLQGGMEYMARRFLFALVEDFQKYCDSHPEAGYRGRDR